MLAALPDHHGELDAYFMAAALTAARQAAALGEVPVGAVLVRAGEVLACAHNTPIKSNDPTAHAEILVLREAAHQENNYRLPGTTLYVTLEPCLMCVGALLHARVERVVFGCHDPKAGALGSRYDVGRDGCGNHRLEVTRGILAEPARVLLQMFFQSRRGA